MINKALKLTTFIITTGEVTEKKCHQAVLNQTLRPNKIIFIRNIKGIHNSLNKVHQQATSDYFCRIDADMILYSHCLWTLYKEIKKDSKIYDARAFLKDSFLGKIGHIHLYRTALVKKYVFKDKIASDIGLEKYCLGKGYKHVVVDKILGIHHPHYSFRDIKDKFTREGQIIAYFNSHDTFRRDFYHLIKLINQKNTKALIALIYLCSGILKQNHLGEKNYAKLSQQEIDKEYKLFKKLNLDLFIEKEPIYTLKLLINYLWRYINKAKKSLIF